MFKRFIVIILFLLFYLNTYGVADLISKFYKASDSKKQYQLIKTIKSERSDKNISFFINVLSKDYGYDIKRIAIQGLKSEISSLKKEQWQKITGILQNETNNIVIQMELSLLSRKKDPQDTALFVSYLQSPDINVRETAVKSLYSFGTEDSVPAVQELLKKETSDSFSSKNIRKYCYLILAKYPQKVSGEELKNNFSDSLNDKKKSDESIYALTALNAKDKNIAKEVVADNLQSVKNADLKSALSKTIGDDMAVGQNMKKSADTAVKVKPASVQTSRVDYDIKSINIKSLTKEEAVKEIEVLQALEKEMEQQLKKGVVEKEYYSKLGDIRFVIGNLYKKNKQYKEAKAYYQKATAAYREYK